MERNFSVFQSSIIEFQAEFYWFNCSRIGGEEEINIMIDLLRKDPSYYFPLDDPRKLINSSTKKTKN